MKPEVRLVCNESAQVRTDVSPDGTAIDLAKGLGQSRSFWFQLTYVLLFYSISTIIWESTVDYWDVTFIYFVIFCTEAFSGRKWSCSILSFITGLPKEVSFFFVELEKIKAITLVAIDVIRERRNEESHYRNLLPDEAFCLSSVIALERKETNTKKWYVVSSIKYREVKKKSFEIAKWI